jgi:predicted nucleotidyltransferase
MESVSQELLQDAVERLVQEFRPEAIYLFGSHAWGTPDADSDLDFFVVVPESDEPPIKRAQRGHRCLRGLGKPKDVLVHTRSEVDRFKHLRASLSHQVLHQGRKLYG